MDPNFMENEEKYKAIKKGMWNFIIYFGSVEAILVDM